MKILLALTAMLFVAPAAFAYGPCFFMDFDEDGIADNDAIIDRVDLGFFVPATLLIKSIDSLSAIK